MLADPGRDLVGESRDQGASAGLCTLVNIGQQHADFRRCCLVEIVRIGEYIGPLVGRCRDPLKQRTGEFRAAEETCQEGVFQAEPAHIFRHHERTAQCIQAFHEAVGRRILRLAHHIEDLVGGLLVQSTLPVLDEIGHHDRDLDRAGGGEGHIRVDGNLLAFVHCKMDFLSVLQVEQVDTHDAIVIGDGDILLEQDFQVVHGGAGSRAALVGEHDDAVAG